MRVLLVEDEEHKTTDLRSRLQKAGYIDEEVTIAGSVREAVLEVLGGDFELLVLDMALPTFSKIRADEGGGGLAQAVGGIEVLRALQSVGKSINIIIVTQYPDIIVNGEKVKLSHVGKVISKKYNQNVIGAVLYSYNTPKWESSFDNMLGKVKCE